MAFNSKSPPLRELTSRQIQWIGAGALMTLSSIPGQTIFIAQFNTALRDTFGLSHGAFGLLYTLATLSASLVFVWAGGLADKLSPRNLALICLAGLSAMAVAMSLASSIIFVGIVLFGLRIFGQSMMTHIAQTTMLRWFNRFRGRALSFTQLGFTLGESTLPFVVTLGIVAIGWRQVWLITAVALLLVLAPLIALLLRDPPDGKRAKALGIKNPDADTSSGQIGKKWTRSTVLRDPLFYALIPGFMGPPAIGTLYIFHQASLSGLKGWEITTFTAFFPVLSITSVASAMITGILIDRIGAWRLVPVVLVPLGLGSVIIATLDPVWTIPLFFMLFGISMGMMNTTIGALWAELYGTAHIGAVRALAASLFVFASAVGPGIAGVLIDNGIALDVQSFFYAGFCFVAAIGYTLLHSRMKARVEIINAERASFELASKNAQSQLA